MSASTSTACPKSTSRWYECGICIEMYGLETGKAPATNSNNLCGHTFCRSCFSQLAVCPFCREKITGLMVNFTVIEALEEKIQQIKNTQPEVQGVAQTIDHLVNTTKETFQVAESSELPRGLIPSCSTDVAGTSSAPAFESEFFDLPQKQAAQASTSATLTEAARLKKISQDVMTFVNAVWAKDSLSAPGIVRQDLIDLWRVERPICRHALDKIGKKIESFWTNEFNVLNKLNTCVEDLHMLISNAAIPEAAESGNVVALYCIGYLLEKTPLLAAKLGLTEPHIHFSEYYRQAALRNYAPALTFEGCFYKRVDYLMFAANLGDLKGMYYLGISAYRLTFPDVSHRFIETAAELGLAEAQYELGLYYKGRKALYDASLHIHRAANQGYVPAIVELNKLNKPPKKTTKGFLKLFFS